MENTDLQTFPLDTALVVRYCAGETTEQENLWVHRWERENSRNAAWLAETREFWTVVSDAGESWNVDAMRTRMMNAMASLESGTNVSERMVPATIQTTTPTPDQYSINSSVNSSANIRGWFSNRLSMRSMFAVGAAACALLGAIWIGETVVNPRDVFFEASMYATPKGQRANVTLPDGSTVSLNVGSRLLVPADFAAGNRVVRLDGEALFSVNHQSKRPFTVIAGASVTKVLGTRFAIRHYDSDSSVTVAVQDGKVSVQRAEGERGMLRADEVVLSARQQLEVSMHSISPVVPTVDAQFSFVRNRLIIDGRKLRDVIPDLNRWYDTDIRLGDPQIGDMELILESTGNSIGDLQMVLEETLSLRVTRDGRTINIYRR